MPSLSLSLLGSFQATLDGQPIAGFESNKVRALLAYLAVEADRPHARDELIGLLWPDQPDATARANLRQALANLRNAIGDRTSATPFLSTTVDSIQFQRTEQCSIDVVVFTELIAACRAHTHRRLETCRSCAQRAQQAVELYRGDFLAQFVQSGSEAFEEWVLIQRERLHRDVLDALYAVAEHHDRRSEFDQVRHYATRQLELDPWREEAHRQLMRALALSGQRSAALAQYDKCRRALAEELGADPSKETTALCEQIKADALTRAERRNNLPTSLTPLIGREHELAEIDRLLETPACRLLTLTGPGGIGKTRLALQAGADHIGLFADGVWLVELASLTDPTLVPQAVASTFDLREQSTRPPLDILSDFLKRREILLVLDNCEHLVVACARLADDLLRACPQLNILATSREGLNIAGEAVFRVPSLSTPDLKHLPASDTLTQYAAVQLFVERAVTAVPDFAVTDNNAPAIAQICHQLDGMPLAIELAAARVKMLSVAQVAARLDYRFRLLTNGNRAALPRQQTLRATIDWSYDLLSKPERAVLRQLAVFAGGWTLEAADAVCTGDNIEADMVLGMLNGLYIKSMIIAERHPGEEARYRMLETIRQYARDKLLESGEAGPARGRHLDFFLAFAVAAELKLRGPEQIAWLKRLDAEHDNLRTAMDWALESGRAQSGLQMAVALLHYWWLRGYWREGRERLEKLLARAEAAEHNPTRAAALTAAGELAFYLSDPEAAGTWLEESQAISLELGAKGKPHLAWSMAILGDGMIIRDKALAQRTLDNSLVLTRETDDTWHLAVVLVLRGNLASSQGNYVLARTFYNESLALFREMGDQWGIAMVIGNLGTVFLSLGDYGAARSRFQEGLVVCRALGDRFNTANALENLGCTAQLQDDPPQAILFFEEGLAIYREIGSRENIAWMLGDLGIAAGQLGESARAAIFLNEALHLSHEVGNAYLIALCLLGLAGIQRQSVRAAQLLAAAQAAFETRDEIVEPFHRAAQERIENATRAALGKELFATAWTEGRTMTLEQAIDFALTSDDDTA